MDSIIPVYFELLAPIMDESPTPTKPLKKLKHPCRIASVQQTTIQAGAQ